MSASPDEIREDVSTLKLGIYKQFLKSVYVFSSFISDNLVLLLLLPILHIFGYVAPNPPVIVSDPIGIQMTGEGLSILQFSKGLVILWVIGNSVKLYLKGAPQIQLATEGGD